jgi:hypothetical protein
MDVLKGLNRAPGPTEHGTEPWLTTKRFTAPPFNKPVWRERGHDLTVCGICQRLWLPEHGPVCTDCRKARQKAKAQRRRARRGGAA